MSHYDDPKDLSILGGAGDDSLFDGPQNGSIDGGGGDDRLTAFWGRDTLIGGTGDDRLESRSDADELAPAHGIAARGDLQGDEDAQGRAHGYNLPADTDDVLTGGDGADLFFFRGGIDARVSIAAKHTNANGVINWHGVAGENDNTHDHWVESFGNDVITDFNAADGDRIRVEAHIIALTYAQLDADGDGAAADPNGAHDQDALGTITVLNANVADVQAAMTSEKGVFHGAANTLAELTALNQVAQGFVADVRGRGAADTQLGGATDDQIRGGSGNDTLLGLGGDDTLAGGDGWDQLGTITVLNAELDANDVTVNAGVFYGAFETLAELEAGWM